MTTLEQKHQQINSNVEIAEAHQKALGVSDAEFAVKYAQFVGSAKTWREKLCKRQFAEFGKNFPRWETKMENFAAELNGRSHIDSYLESMPFARRMDTMLATLRAIRTDRRCGVCLGPTGVGKSAWARHAVQKDPRGLVYVRANESWRDNRSQILAGLAKGLSCQVVYPISAPACLQQAIEALQNNPVTVILDEAHEMGVVGMKLVKTLIDETSGRFILLAFPTTWAKMRSASDDARAEATQLFGRSLKPIFDDYAHGLKQEDVATYLKLAAGLGEEAIGLAKEILAMVKANGNLRLLSDAVERAQQQSDLSDIPVSAELIRDHVRTLCPIQKGGKE